MAIQTYIKRANAYTAALVISGADADQVLGVYQVFVSLTHEWGEPVYTHSKLATNVDVGATTIEVLDATGFSVGNKILFNDGNVESATISAISGTSFTISALTKRHNAGTYVSVEQVATRASANNYSIGLTAGNLAASGNYRLRWRYVRSGVSEYSEQQLHVYQPYVDSGTFFDIYPELETANDDGFDNTERIVREIINTFCGQSFDYFPGKSLTFDGSGKNSLYLSLRLEELSEVILKPSDDITEIVEIDPESKYFLRLTDVIPTIPSSVAKPRWGDASQFQIKGNWGWTYVPDNVTQAAMLLLADKFNDDSAYTRHGIVEVYMDTHRMRFDKTILGTTGNIDADVLLMDFTLFVMGII